MYSRPVPKHVPTGRPRSPRAGTSSSMRSVPTQDAPKGASNLSPLPQEIVIDARELHDGRMIGHLACEALNRDVHVEQQCATRVVADHALQPEERAYSDAARHRIDPVQARRRIQDHVTGRQLDALRAVGVFDHELSAVDRKSTRLN